jgi:uncharacterized protein (DUF2225 family)
MQDEKIKRISFRQKNLTTCPVCGFEFYREDMLTGGGRLIAGKLTNELRRSYEVSKKFGTVYPLVYVLTVCPGCLYAAHPKDFEALKQNEVEKLRELIPSRKNTIRKFFGNIDFNNDRNLLLGAASYMLSIDCYSFRNKTVAPTFKNAVSSLRASWLFDDLAKQVPDKSYDKISTFFYKKAYLNYLKVIEYIQNGQEPADAAGNMGPDTDKNWGYEGILYLMAVLTVKVGSLEPDINARIESFDRCKRYLSRLFGAGKTSKNKPSELLDKTRDMYDKINMMLDKWNEEVAKGNAE